jgi:hypothetical protein
MKSGKMNAVRMISVAMLFAACSSGGGDGGGTSPVAAPATGVFVDDPVQNLPYSTATQGGVTDSNGQFRYRPGESITFSYGQTTLGTIAGVSQITPWTVFGLATPDPADNRWVNLARLLQTFNNQLPAVTQQIAALPAINFNLDPATFETDPDVGQLLTTAGAPQALVTAAQATATLQQQFAILGSWFAQNTFGPNFVVFTAMADGTFVISEDGSSDQTGRDGMERGIYTWNLATGAFAATVQVDTNGQNGISHANPPFTATVTGNTLTFTDGNGDQVVLARVTDTNVPANPAVGAWRFDNTDGPGTMAVVTLFANGTFVLVTDESASINDGMERGTYSPAANNDVSFTRTVDTNGNAGIFDPAVPGPVGLNVVVNGDMMTVTEQGSSSFIGTRLRPPQ